MGNYWSRARRPMHVSLPKVTISAFTETGREESSIIVPLQRAYTSREPVISSWLADTPCAILGVQGLLDQLNTTLGTSYSLDNLFLSSLLEDFIKNNYNFGMAYSCLRRIWYTDDWSTVQDVLRRWRDEDQEGRRRALVRNRIVNPHLPPRRVWDLYSNRVVPWWLMPMEPVYKFRPPPKPISHAWMDEKDRTAVWTPINGNEWPVPIPKDTNLNLIRIEMLNLGLEYAWLDVLCLRQVGGRREDLRTEEWKLDVPTIGRVYHSQNVVIYLSGLGRPLTLKEGDLDSDRSWFRRAWTLQEVGKTRVIAGDTPDGPLHAKCKNGKYETELLTRFHKQLQSMHEMWEVRDVLEEMRKRVSTNPVDRIAGLAFLMRAKWIPAYYESASLEEAWSALVNSMDADGWPEFKLFFLCPEPGNAGTKWRPSWDQVMTRPLPMHCVPQPGLYLGREYAGGRAEEVCGAHCIEGLVRGMAFADTLEGDRHGELIVEDRFGIEHEFRITAAHTYPIPEDFYTLVCTCYIIVNENSSGCGWVVGRRLPGERFEKVTTVVIALEEYNRICNQDIMELHRYILI
ncbi:hypothetical protein IW262DRAFT_126801 [Armillaria fumosa]|nr:hypothetical protein IW262DRAFT_126801 [Armillaria fumosa]